MRRKTRLGLAVFIPLFIAFGLYTAYWLTVADRLKHGLADWAQEVRGQRIEASWQNAGVGGFPFVFRIELRDVRLSDAKLSPAPELRVARLSGSTAPWDFRHWRLTAPEGFAGELAGDGQRLPVKLAGEAATGEVAVDTGGHATIWLNVQHPAAEAAASIAARSADCWVVLPTRAPSTHTDPSIAVAVLLRNVKLPLAPAPFGDTVEEIAVGATLMGAVPSGPLRDAVAAWRDAGGTFELDNLHVDWGALGVTASGTLALDADLQPMGSFSGAIQGYDQVMGALVAMGRLRPGDIGLARVGLAMLAKVGPNGRPEIRTSFSIQNGEMRLGPVKLGKVPRIVWE